MPKHVDVMLEAELELKRGKVLTKLARHMEKESKMSPVASKMMASIILTCERGVTFEEMVNEFGVSKSTVSENLSKLEARGRIESFMKKGDRKRYYRPISNEFIRFIDEKIKRNEEERRLQIAILEYKKEMNKTSEECPENQCRVNFHENILIFLEESISSFKKLKVTLTEE